ncbi:hypothetical protein AGMMS49949_03180 [Alphaproteobacteria bacterium]|nr:hypothetical protein AGMMS49949_03180 [Alphaproteobacteria bacterium]GHS97358.1 hypothetical protein AGMMS50296_4270 [Alphaproteobacteria bacterium]
MLQYIGGDRKDAIFSGRLAIHYSANGNTAFIEGKDAKNRMFTVQLEKLKAEHVEKLKRLGFPKKEDFDSSEKYAATVRGIWFLNDFFILFPRKIFCSSM